MAETRTYNYEGMFLISQAVAADFKAAIDHIRSIIEKHGGSVIAMKKWDERRLAFEIAKQKRGIYILTYFSAPAKNMGEFERSCNLSESIMRVLTVRADHLTIDEMKAADDAKGLETEAKLRASQPAMAMAEVTPVATLPEEDLIDEV